jgi:GTP-binding protein
MSDPSSPRAAVQAGPRVAIVGRTNVGKSTLVNRLAGRRQAIAHETPGVTRDRLEVPVRWGNRFFSVIDTGGYIPRARGMEASVVRQAAKAMEEADLILLLVDATTGIQDEDETLARALRRTATPVLVVANKVDAEAQEPATAEFHALGLGEPVPVSALHGRGSGDLLDRVLEIVPDRPQPEVETEYRFALVGRPNVGKSSVLNRILGAERVVVHDQPGTTRDAIDAVVEVQGRRIRFVDTAGLRRQIKTQGLEYYGLLRSLRAIDGADVVALVLDASSGLTGEDKRIAERITEAGKALVAVANKWDLVPSEERAARFRELTEQLAIVPGAPVLRTSALTGAGAGRLLPSLVKAREAWSRRVPTSEVNAVIQAATAANPPPRQSGRILYATQVASGPPSFVMFGARNPPPAYRRYLENQLRKAFGFAGSPVRLSFRPRHPDRIVRGAERRKRTSRSR